jgi:hypothetical protein
VSFSWRANPPDDYVLGYRLYYGTRSRFDSTGKPRPGFSYDYYIDSYEMERCVARETETDCTPLSPDEVVYTNLSGDMPDCTLYNLQGRLYFALTAYNAQEESDYTVELKVTLGKNTSPSPTDTHPDVGVLAALQQINALLLKKKK